MHLCCVSTAVQPKCEEHIGDRNERSGIFRGVHVVLWKSKKAPRNVTIVTRTSPKYLKIVFLIISATSALLGATFDEVSFRKGFCANSQLSRIPSFALQNSARSSWRRPPSKISFTSRACRAGHRARLSARSRRRAQRVTARWPSPTARRHRPRPGGRGETMPRLQQH